MVKSPSGRLLSRSSAPHHAAALRPREPRAGRVQTEVSAQSAAYSVPSPGEATLRLDYPSSVLGTPLKQLVSQRRRERRGSHAAWVRSSRSRCRAGQSCRLLVQDDAGSVTTDNLSELLRAPQVITWLRGAATVSTQTVKVASWKSDATYGWPDARTDAFVVPKGVTGFRAVLEATSADAQEDQAATARRDAGVRRRLPNERVFFDLDATGPRSRVLKKDGAIAGSELVVAYAEPRAERLPFDTGTVERRMAT